MKRKIAAALVAGGTLIALLGATVVRAQKRMHVIARDHDAVIGWPGSVGQTWLGVRLVDVTAEKARELKLSGEYGALVTGIESDSPAAKAGLVTNDVIVEFEGERVRSVAELRRLIRETPPGRTVNIQVQRAGQTRAFSVALASREALFGELAGPVPPVPPEMPEIKIPDFHFHILGGARLGISADELTPQLASYFGVKQGKGVLAREVKSGSPAEKAGLKAGDCIVRMDSTEIGSVEDLRRALSKTANAKPGEKREVSLTVVRNRREETVKAELQSPDDRLRHHTTEAEEIDFDPEEFDGIAAEIEALKPQIQTEAERLRQQAADFRTEIEPQVRRQVSEMGRQIESQRRELENQLQELKPQIQELRKQLQQKRSELERKLDSSVV